mmetsp:Transcript_33330/g.51078  ORF Transcript_33330/g.51078 Transcript_33330/m.51078 type:complete len:147 (-) Transcript_33330:9-449(-)
MAPTTVQKCLYNLLVINLVIIALLLFRPHSVAQFIRKRAIFIPLTCFVFFIQILFFRNNLTEYYGSMELLPDEPQDRVASNIEFVRFQKQRHKLERDFYLSLSSMLAQGVVMGLSYWIEKYDTYVKFKEAEEKASHVKKPDVKKRE